MNDQEIPRPNTDSYEESQARIFELEQQVAILLQENSFFKSTQRLFSDGRVVLMRWQNKASFPVDFVTPNVMNLVGYTQEDFLSGTITFAQIMDENDLARFVETLSRASQAGDDYYEQADYRLVHKEGHRIWVHESTMIIRSEDGTITHYLAYIINVTARKTAELELEKSHKQQQKTLTELLLAKEQTESANKAKTEFLSMMSHELRTPLNSIMGHIQILLMGKHRDPSIQKQLETIRKSANHLLQIINDILDLASLESGRTSYQENTFSIQQLVQSVITMFWDQISSNQLSVNTIIPDIYIRTDKAKLRQILTNLISNAVKFTPSGGSIQIIMEDHDHEMIFMVQDTGIGISPDKMQHIFTPFFQADTTSTRDYEGTGLGLALCKHLVRELQGEIWVESQVSVGSTFHFTIRNNPVSEDQIKKVTEDSMEQLEFPKETTVLVVDDDKMGITVVTTLLSKYGVKSFIAQSGNEALEVLERHAREINLILMDLDMPDMDGFETTAHIKANNKWHHIPIIAITAYSRVEDQKRSQLLGCDDYLTKPFDIQEFLQIIHRWLPGSGTSK